MQLKGTPLPHKLHSQLEEFEKRTNPEAKKNGALKGLTKLAPKHSADGHKAVLPRRFQDYLNNILSLRKGNLCIHTFRN